MQNLITISIVATIAIRLIVVNAIIAIIVDTTINDELIIVIIKLITIIDTRLVRLAINQSITLPLLLLHQITDEFNFKVGNLDVTVIALHFHRFTHHLLHLLINHLNSL